MKRTVGCLLSVCLVLVLLSGCRREPGQSGAEGTSAGPDSAQTSPAQPPSLHTVLQIRYAGGPAPGNFFWGRMDFWEIADGRG